MTTKEKAVGHTALPWEVFHRRGDFPEREIHSVDSVIATVHKGSDNHLPVERNAAFIVRAANSHYQLLSALKGVTQSLRIWLDEFSREYPQARELSPSTSRVIECAEEAIARAEEGL